MNQSGDSQASRGRILAVDDTPANLRLLVNMLTEQGYVVHPAGSGAAALRSLRETLPDLILLDVMMPELDGFHVCEQLKADARTHDIPVIFISAADQILDKVTAFSAGGADYVVKPFQAEEVLARIETHMALRGLQRRLEERVAERTAELTAVNARLNREIAERRVVEEALRERESRIRRLVESNIIGVYFWDMEGGISDANDAFLRVVGHRRDDLLAGRVNWVFMTPPEHVRADGRALEEIAQRGSCAPYEKEFTRKDGRRVPVLVGGALIEGSQDKGIAFVLDLSERKKAEQGLVYVAQHDMLTGLPNRQLLFECLTAAVQEAGRYDRLVGIVCIGLDRFKTINDSLGPAIGDQVLKEVGRRLRQSAHVSDTVARVGGDEFVVVLGGIGRDTDIAHQAREILSSFRKPFQIGERSLFVGASLGIAVSPHDGEDVEGLMRNADAALDRAKQLGRNNYQFYAAEMTAKAQARLALEQDLRHALEAGEFALHYHPVVNLGTREIIAAEALIRWQHPQRGWLMPDEFIPVAEDSGLILPIGDWVLRTACAQASACRVNGTPPVRMIMNLSARQFQQKNLVDELVNVLQQTKVEPQWLTLEITEGTLMQTDTDAEATLHRLKDLGVRISVDDFGTGYSSLTYLKRFPISVLKIDRSFVDGIGQDPNDEAIVQAIIAMAHSLHIEVVAEGVETECQLAFLRAHDCEAVQGYYFSRPLPPEEFVELLQRGRPLVVS